MGEPDETAAVAAPRVRIGVVLAWRGDALGEWVADAAAFDAAGVDALWVECGPEFDPLAVTAALTAVTHRALLVTRLPVGAVADAGLARALATLVHLSRGRLALLADPDRLGELAAQVPGGVFRRLPDDPVAYTRSGGDGGRQRWVQAAPPRSRDDWQVTLQEAAAQGASGVFAPGDSGLLDILRNPGPGDRSDLLLAQG